MNITESCCLFDNRIAGDLLTTFSNIFVIITCLFKAKLVFIHF